MMASALRRVAVVGASLAGLRAVEALRRRGYEGALSLIGDEAQAPYDRPPLSKQLLRGEWTPERTTLRKQGLDDLSLDLRLGVRALRLDARARRLRLSDGELDYDALIIATGASARHLPFGRELLGVHVLRTLQDAQAIAAELSAGPRVCVIGAGFIGLEVAASCRQLGLAVSAIEATPLPLAGRLGETMAQHVAALHREHGVDLRTGVSVAGLEGSARVERVRLSDGSTLAADLVVVGIGVSPNTGWLADSGLVLGDGVSCDERCQTSVPGVFAAGDVASWPNALFGTRMRVEHWSNAVEQADAAAACLLEGPQASAPFTPVPYFWSDQYDVKIQFAGWVEADDEVVVLERDEAGKKLCALYARADRLVGVLTFGRPARLIKYRRMIAERASLQAALAAS